MTTSGMTVVGRAKMRSMNHASYLSRFAAIALGGLNLQPGQTLAIKVEPENLDTAVAVATLAYRRGARYVDIWSESTRMLRSRVDNSDGEHLEYLPEYRHARNEEFLRDRWALLSIKSPANPAVMDGASATRTGIVARAESIADAVLRRGLSVDANQWCVMAVPSPQWAAMVMGMPAGDDALRAMWEALTPILRLEEENPVAFWHDHSLGLEERARRLTGMGIRKLRFSGPGTDLTVELHEAAVWKGGGATTADGRRFSPNIPTEEVFTTPYAPTVHGHVAISRPVRVYGQLVQGAWMEFQEGRVIDVGAETGAEALNAYLEVDEGSRFMGEIALVDCDSPIFQSGLLFHNILLDENAASHFALGFAYPTCIAGGASMSDPELLELGANRSRQHLDFMIGNDRMDVTAVLQDGRERTIMTAGRFVD